MSGVPCEFVQSTETRQQEPNQPVPPAPSVCPSGCGASHSRVRNVRTRFLTSQSSSTAWTSSGPRELHYSHTLATMPANDLPCPLSSPPARRGRTQGAGLRRPEIVGSRAATTTAQHLAGFSSVDQAAVDLVGSHRPGRVANKAVLFLDQIEGVCQDLDSLDRRMEATDLCNFRVDDWVATRSDTLGAAEGSPHRKYVRR